MNDLSVIGQIICPPASVWGPESSESIQIRPNRRYFGILDVLF
jgi:hypothetical protein